MEKLIRYATVIITAIAMSGCASSTDIERKANLHAKAGKYYESIGQPGAAKEEYHSANESWQSADDLFPLLIELFNLFSSEKDNN